MAFNDYKKEFIELLDDIESQMLNFIYLLWKKYQSNNSIYIIGNGGSCSNASHFAQDLVKATSKISLSNVHNTQNFKAISLCDNTSFITAIANDEGYENIFISQLKAQQICDDDLLIAISGSGNSQNIINTIKFAKQNNIETFGIVGFNGGKVKKIVDYFIHINSNNMFMVESAHLFIFHYVIERLKKMRENE